jgi:dienelactone hydrolase
MNAARSRKTWLTSACVIPALIGLGSVSAASAEQLVRFDSAARSGQAGEPVQGYLSRPNGAGPFAGIVLLHSCLGLPANRRAIAETIASWGYVALFVDEFATRGLKQTCAADFSRGVADAFGGQHFLSTLPYVDPLRIAAVGYSQGADAALKIASLDSTFKAAAAFYPPCANEGGEILAIPTLILIGGQDLVTPAGDCEKLVNSQPDRRAKLVVYPGARHGFDNPSFAGGKRALGMMLGYDRTAAGQSAAALRDFLGASLAR